MSMTSARSRRPSKLKARVVISGFVLLFAGEASAARTLATIQPQPSHEQQRSGADLYAAACANCHGADGRGAPPALVAFTDPLPDFRDCRFATREPDTDWLAIVHDGGPARAFARMMPAFGAALTTDQIERVLAHLRTLCEDPSWPRGELNFPRPLVTEKAFPEDEVVLSTAVATRDAGVISNKLVYERRIGPRNQMEVVVPFTFSDARRAPEGERGWRGGVGDLTLGMKRAIVHSLARGAIVSAAGEIVLPVGDEGLGLSRGTAVFEPFVALGQMLPASGFLQAQAGLELPFDRDVAAREAFWRVAVGRSFSQRRWGRTWSPMIEVLAARELQAGQVTHWDLAPQMQVTLSTRQHVMASAGVRLPVNAREQRHPQLLFYLLWDWFDGPLFGGW
jgi:hypothetical protein